MNIRLLHIEDNPQDAWLVHRVLRDDGWIVDPYVISSKNDLLVQMSQPWDVVLADFGLPGMSTTEALDLVRQNQPDLPFIVVSGQIGEENAVALMKAGADDYVSKNFPTRLSPVLHRILLDRNAKKEQKAERLVHQELENRFRQFFHQNLSGMVMLTPSGKIQEINRALVELLFLDPENLPRFWNLFASPDLAALVRKRLESGESFGPEVVEMRRSDGVQAFLLSTYQLPGAKPLIWANFIDHTEQLKLQEQVFQTRKLESLGQLAGGIAHEFNNILAIFQGHLSLLARESPLESSIASRIQVLQRTTLRGASVVKQLLNLARRRPIKEETFGADTLLSETVRLVQGLFPETLTLSVNCEPDLPFIRGDRDQLGQAMLNLVINARDAMPEGGTIVLAAYRSPSDDSCIRIEVADEGAGVPPELVSRIFDPFFTTKQEGKGTGLGLSLVATVARAHRGTFGVEPRLPRGSAFYIVLPQAAATSEDAAQTAASMEDRAPEGTVVVLVENEDDLASFESAVLKNHGYEVTRFTNGDEAWQWLRSGGKAFAVVTDLGMPGMPGETFCAEVQGLVQPPVLIVQSGNLEPAAQLKLKELGVDEFLLKPFTSEELLSCLQRRLAWHQNKR